MSEWLVELGSSDDDIQGLARLFTSAECSIVAHEDRYFLSSVRFQSLTTPNKVLDAAERLVECVNAVGLLTLEIITPFTLGGVWQMTDTGHLCRQRATPSIHSVELSWSDGMEEPLMDPQATAKLARLQLEDEDVRDVMELWARCPLDWFTLKKIGEILSDAVDGYDEISNRGWANKADLKLLHDTAQDYQAIGVRAARHARFSKRSKPLENPMAISDAREIARIIVVKWLVSRVENGE